MTPEAIEGATGGPGRVFVVWNNGEADVDAEIARLAGPGGLRPEDATVVLRWLGDGELPPSQVQARWNKMTAEIAARAGGGRGQG